MNRRLTLAAVAFVLTLTALGLLATWPVYDSVNFLAAAGIAALVGIAAALLRTRLRWPGWLTAVVLLVAFVAISLAFAIPARWAGGGVVPDGLLDIVTGPVTGWKDLITAPLPVGTYRNLLVPAVALFLVAPFAATALGERANASAALAVPVAALMPVYGMLFGRTATSPAIDLGPFHLTAPLETAVGAAGVISGIGWLAWRAREQRRAALRRAQEGTDAAHVVSSNRHGATLRRGAMAASMLVVAGLVGVAATPAITETRSRDVLRSAIGPDLSITAALSPLATYRENFRDSAYDSVLFRVSSEQRLPERIRIATLAWYDGEVYRAAEGEDSAFQRVPSTLSTPEGVRSTVTFQMETHASVWLPTFGSLAHIDFRGADATDMADRFYYDAATGTAVEAGGVITGQTYDVTAVVPAQPDLAEAEATQSAIEEGIPESLRTWVDGLDVSRDGAGLASAISTLRERGYLSHALALTEGETPLWMAAMPGYDFRSSAAGHSLARVDALFAQLLEREAQAGADDTSLVAAIGDDEQFAVAGALIAQYLGFPARVVVGVRTADEELPSCADGVCTGADVSAWIEVDAGGGAWASVDTTPQYAQSVETKTSQQRDPENMTEVRPDTAEAVAPPDPEGAESEAADDAVEPTADLSQIWEIIRWVGIGALGLLILLGPALIVLIAKAVRRRRRRQDPDAARAIAGGWEEYVDTAVDVGKPAPGARTRNEVAAEYGTPHAQQLAVLADRAVFSGEPAAKDEADEFWSVVAGERRALRGEVGWWRRVRSALSLTSFTRHFSARGNRKTSPAPARRTERRKRRPRDA